MRPIAVLALSATLTVTGLTASAIASDIIWRDQNLAQADTTFSAQATESQAQMVDDENDPLEGLNRGIFEFNRVVDGMLIKPAAQIYRGVLPQQAQDSVRNFLRNLRSPVILANDLLQGDGDRAGKTVGRFLVNSTLGVLGLFDVASDLGMPFHDEDFGQTLAVWGVGEGFYLVLPILGPSSPRDLAGLGAEFFLDPVNLYLRKEDLEYLTYVRAGVRGVDARARAIDVLDELERTSLDYYAAIRSLYRQQRANDINNSRSPDDPKGAAPSVSKAAVTLPDDVVSFRN